MSTEPADAVREALPALPVPVSGIGSLITPSPRVPLHPRTNLYTAEQMHAYALEAIRLAALAGAAPVACDVVADDGTVIAGRVDVSVADKLFSQYAHTDCRKTNFLFTHAPAKAREEQDMAVLDKYAELARALGFEGDAWFGDPLASHAEIVARAKAQAEWQPMETAPTFGVILLAVEGGSERKTFVAEASHEDGGMVWCVTSGWTGWTNLHRGWTPVAWRKLPERAALATFAEGGSE